MEKYLLIKCNNTEVHTYENREYGEGNVLAFLKDNTINIKCSDNKCKRWIQITVDFPGLDFSKARFSQKKQPIGHVFNAKKAPIIIEE